MNWQAPENWWKDPKQRSKYCNIHTALRKKFGSAPLCIWDKNHLGKYHWANVTDIYTTDIEDYLPMCRSCHAKFDMTDKCIEAARQRITGNKWGSKGPLYQLRDKQVIKVWEGIYEAQKGTGILATSIVNNIKGRSKSAGGYVWTREIS